MRILHAPTNVANQGWAIAEGLRALGHEVEVWQVGPNPFGFPCDRALDLPERPADLWPRVSEALERFDVFHFHFARSLVPRAFGPIPGLWDLPLYRAAGKPVFFTFHGSDVRTRGLHLEVNPWSYFRYADVDARDDDIRKRLEIIRSYANATFVCSPVNQIFVPDAGFHPRAILVERWPAVGPVRRDVPLVVHIPSRRATKGTEFVLAGVGRAKEEGLRFDFRLVENLPHDEVGRVMAESDIVVDNLLLGDYEVSGLEAMCMGKTVIARIEEQVERRMGEVPVLNADPDTFAAALRRAVSTPELRSDLGAKARAFVERNHASTVVARRLLDSYEDPPHALDVSHPDWASLADARREERLERQVVELRAALRGRGGDVVISGLRRGPFAKLGTRLDEALRKVGRRR